MRPTRFREFWEFTVEKVAVNAVMAGARPEYFPVILALAAERHHRAIEQHHSFATISVVNGPIRNEIGMNSGIGVIGPYNHANATIGRAYGLLSQNLQGGSVPGDTYMGSLGNWYAYSADLPGSGGAQPLGAAARAAGLQADRQHRQHLLRRLVHACRLRPARDLAGEDAPLPAAAEHYSPPLLVMDPIVARGFRRSRLRHQGEADRLVRRECAAAGARVLGQSVDPDADRPLAVAGVEPYATRLKAKPDELVQNLRAEGHPYRGGGRRDAGRLEDVRRLLGATDGLDRRVAVTPAAIPLRSLPLRRR